MSTASLSPLARVSVVVIGLAAALLVPATLVVVGWDRLETVRRTARGRLRTVAPSTGVLIGVLLFNKLARDVAPELSWLVGVNITGSIYAVEGAMVATIQSFATPVVTLYFSAVYLVGYVFLLVFPFVAYFALADLTRYRQLTAAFVLNYTVGLACYVIFIAYGPRNLLPGAVDPLLYTTFPRTQLLTSEVNVNTNVFPSLHTSLSTTVATFAWWTRETYPRWALAAVTLATSVALATMYLGIHWFTDVVAGFLLGLGCAVGSVRLTAREG